MSVSTQQKPHRMLFSLRWVLPVSYMLIALMVMLAMRILLFIALSEQYRRVDHAYMVEHGQNVQSVLQGADLADHEMLNIQLHTFAAVADARLTVYNNSGEILGHAPPPSLSEFLIDLEGAALELPSPDDGGAFAFETLPLSPTRDASAVTAGGPAPNPDIPRSGQVVLLDLTNLSTGERVGVLEVSDAPAHGAQPLENVAQNWTLASAGAVSLAAIIGWAVSHYLLRPLFQLTRATQAMSGGNLSVRVNIRRPDEIGQLAWRFNEMVVRVETTMKTMEQFLADAAHELHTPLTALRTNIELLRESHQGPASHRALQQIERLTSLTDDLLDLSRIESSPSQHEWISLRSLVQGVCEIYASRADQKDVAFKLHFGKDPNVFVTGHPAQLRRVIANLLDNAIKFTPSGGVIQVGMTTTTDSVHLVVQDSGIGIPPADSHQLFERFHRGKNATEFEGSGLGLAIVHAIVEQHGGKIVVKRLNPGTRFTVSIPKANPVA